LELPHNYGQTLLLKKSPKGLNHTLRRLSFARKRLVLRGISDAEFAYAE
jgi:hypothetical protein